MRGAAATALLVLLATTLAGASSPPVGPFVTHAPIVISSDADFTATNGVVAGTGTTGDPFVIAGWSITANAGVGINVTNVSKPFVIRDNMVQARYGVQIGAMAAVGTVSENEFITMGVAVTVSNADAFVLNNSFVGNNSLGGTNIGIELVKSDSVVDGNAFIYTPFAVYAFQGSPIIRCNDVHDDTVRSAITVQFTVNATIECNTITSCLDGITALNTIGTVIVNNSVGQCQVGLELNLTKDAVVANNSFYANAQTQVHTWHSSGSFVANVVVDGKTNGVSMDQSPMLVAQNNVSANAGIGFWLNNTAASVSANIVTHNAIGIKLDHASLPNLTANVLADNAIGLDVPYASRQAVLSMSGNVVNGVAIDSGPSQVYYYQAVNVQVLGQVRDSGFSAGYFGSISAQGDLVLYDVDNADVEASTLSHATVGVTAVNSFNVVVHGSVITDTTVGVQARTDTTAIVAPACAVSVKNSTIGVTIDPALTVGIDVSGCAAEILGNDISTVQTGIRLAADVHGDVVANTVHGTDVALDAGGSTSLNVTGNALTDSRIGARFTGTIATVANNTLARDGTGALLTGGAALAFRGNLVMANGIGVADQGPCLAIPTLACGALAASDNVVTANDGDGIRINGTSSFQRDVLSANRGAGARLASATLSFVNASGNGGDGVSLSGTFSIHDSSFVGNGANGASVAGAGDIKRSTFAGDQGAGLFTAASYVDVLDSRFSGDFDGILFQDAANPPGLASVSITAILRAIPSATSPTPLDVHRSVIVGNARDGIRAGAFLVNATGDYWGGGAPAYSIADTVGSFQDGVSLGVRFDPYYTDPGMTTTGPVPGI